MYPLAEQPFIRTEAVNRVKTTQTLAAQRAPSLIIEGKLIQEGSPAADAGEFGLERLRGGQALHTKRNARNGLEGTAADAAIGRKKKGEKGARNGLERWEPEACGPTTREDPPPLEVPLYREIRSLACSVDSSVGRRRKTTPAPRALPQGGEGVHLMQ